MGTIGVEVLLLLELELNTIAYAATEEYGVLPTIVPVLFVDLLLLEDCCTVQTSRTSSRNRAISSRRRLLSALVAINSLMADISSAMAFITVTRPSAI